MNGRELLSAAVAEWDGDYDGYHDTPSGAELIRRADAEPRLRAALEALISHHGSPYCDTRERWWPEACEVAHDGARAALTTPDATG